MTRTGSDIEIGFPGCIAVVLGLSALLLTSLAMPQPALAAQERPGRADKTVQAGAQPDTMAEDPSVEAEDASADAERDKAHDEDQGHGTVVPSLHDHTREFRKEVIEITSGVYQAVGFGLANATMIVGPDGVIIVDVMESVETGREVMAAFREITDKPVAALIYTHNHADHTYGGRGFVPEGEVPVYAHETTEYYINRVLNILRPAIAARSARMFGTYLEDGPKGFVNAGIGPRLEVGGDTDNTPGIIRPTVTFTDRLEVSVAGVDLEMVHAPGETNDQIFVWVPGKRLLLAGDNIYKAFPNLYTIRGTPYRDVVGWVNSLDRMRALRPEHLAMGHTRPISGEERIQKTMLAYRDAIQFVHDQTIRGINKGLTPDEIVEIVKLPDHLRDHPFLIEHYGTVEWSVRNIFTGYLGWFGGDAAHLSPAPPQERAQAIVDLAGGPQEALEKAREALAADKLRWAAELASYVAKAKPELVEASRVQAEALRLLGYRSVSPNGRNYYLTQARELEGEVIIPQAQQVNRQTVSFLKDFPVRALLEAMPVNLVADKSLNADTVIGFRFTDTDEAYTLHVRRGIAALSEGWPEDPDTGVETTTDIWLEVATGQRSLPLAIATFKVSVPTGVLTVPTLLSTLAMFREDAR